MMVNDGTCITVWTKLGWMHSQCFYSTGSKRNKEPLHLFNYWL